MAGVTFPFGHLPNELKLSILDFVSRYEFMHLSRMEEELLTDR
jgi:hypothetical protein